MHIYIHETLWKITVYVYVKAYIYKRWSIFEMLLPSSIFELEAWRGEIIFYLQARSSMPLDNVSLPKWGPRRGAQMVGARPATTPLLRQRSSVFCSDWVCFFFFSSDRTVSREPPIDESSSNSLESSNDSPESSDNSSDNPVMCFYLAFRVFFRL